MRCRLLILPPLACAVTLVIFAACQGEKFGAQGVGKVSVSSLVADAAAGSVPIKNDAGVFVATPATLATTVTMGGMVTGPSNSAAVTPLVLGGHLSGTTADATVTSVAHTAITVAGGVNAQVLTYTDAGVMAKTVAPAVSGAYVPAIVANWADAAPTTIQAALDRIAAKSHPIP